MNRDIVMEVDMEPRHKPSHAAAVVVTCAAYVVTVVFNVLASGVVDTGGLFLNTTGGISAQYPVAITPAGWTFSIWGLIYTWQGLWLIYGLSTLCRSTMYGYMYVAPGHMHWSLYAVFTFNLATNVAWLLLWDRQYIGYALIFLPLTAFSAYVCLFISFRRLYARGPVLIREGKVADVWLTRILVENGIACYAAWVSVATLVNLAAVLDYRANIPEVSGIICLGVLLLEIVVWFFLDNFRFDKYVRYTLTPYLVVVWALTGAVVNNWAAESPIAVLAAFSLATASVATFIKAFLMFRRHWKRPIFSNGGIDTFYSSHRDYGTLGSRKSSSGTGGLLDD